ncbi:hypothetical protein ACU3L3_07030 [Priestia endophytica]
MKGWIEELFGNDLTFKEIIIYATTGGFITYGLFYFVALFSNFM